MTLVEMGPHLATERAGLVTLHLTDDAPDFYPSKPGPRHGPTRRTDKLAKPLIVIQRVQVPPDQSRADRSVVSLAILRATGGCEA